MRHKKTKPKPRPLKKVRDPEGLQEYLAHYAQEAIRLGCTDAKPIRSSDVVIDERVRAKCMIPKCRWYGASIHCPPYAPPVEEVRKLVNAFQWGILMKIEVDPRILAGYNAYCVTANVTAGRKDTNKKFLDQNLQMNHKLSIIVGAIESMAFYDGYYLAMGFGAGSCVFTLCKEKGCQVLQKGTCRFPLRARPSMESCAMDVYRTVTNTGWDIYPLGIECDVSKVKHGIFAGLVLVE